MRQSMMSDKQLMLSMSSMQLISHYFRNLVDQLLYYARLFFVVSYARVADNGRFLEELPTYTVFGELEMTQFCTLVSQLEISRRVMSAWNVALLSGWIDSRSKLRRTILGS